MAVVPDAARLVRIAATGVGLSDAGMGAVVQHFADATARNAMSPTPQVNTLTMLATAPGEVDFWDGTKWLPIADRVNTQPGGTEFLRLSGPYNGITPMTRVMSTVTKTADGAGQFTILDATALAGKAGVFSVVFQPTGTLPIAVVLNTSAGTVVGKAYNLTDGSPAAGQTINGLSIAYVY